MIIIITIIAFIDVIVPVGQARACGHKTLHQQDPPVLNWRCRLTQVDLYNGHKTMVVVVGMLEQQRML